MISGGLVLAACGAAWHIRRAQKRINLNRSRL